LTGKYAQHRKNAVLKIQGRKLLDENSVLSTTPDRFNQQIPPENVIGARIVLPCYDGHHPINFVGIVITNDILGHSRFKSNIGRSFDEHETISKSRASERGKSNTIHQGEAGNEARKWLRPAARVAAMKTGHPKLELHLCQFSNQ
jgi:hypothetical protein